MSTDNKQIPVREGLWTVVASPGELPELIGSKCPHCGEVVFPANQICVNCQYPSMETVRLSRKGKIYSLTTVMLPPPKYYKGPVPYAAGYVELPDGVRVKTLFLDCDPAALALGMEVELVIKKQQEDEGGSDIMVYGFTPVAK